MSGILNGKHHRNDYLGIGIDKVTRDRLRIILCNAWRRCNDVKSRNYHTYGGRGISVSSEWWDSNTRTLNYVAFMKWSVKNGYRQGLQLDRIDNNGNYSPSNCRWVTSSENCRNKRNNAVIDFNGERHCLKEWAEIIGIPYIALKDRRHKKWSVEKMLTTPLEAHDTTITYNGVTRTIPEWAKFLGIKRESLRDRIASGWSIERCMTEKNNGGHNRKITLYGETRTIKEWSRWSGVPYRCLLNRLNRGWDFARAISENVNNR